ncbi:putative sugar nucleotidyl transferase [Pleomorphovibrio marinus]|uniref:putative sugar nucleotidyl transferase n=1 Tax=Pleomorphovibrio marinus TaxID=2164132 RepID=UPI000E0B92A0|nr:putative sugar nucleotidyl transferase [Pleomorphovibrio marinus]
MDQIVLFDDPKIRGNLLPFTFTRPVGEIRIGILKISEKWERHLSLPSGYLTQPYLQDKYTLAEVPSIMVNGAVCPSLELLDLIQNLSEGESVWQNELLLAASVTSPSSFRADELQKKKFKTFEGDCTIIWKNWNIFQQNGVEIKRDYELLTKRRISTGAKDPYTNIYQESNTFIETGAKIKSAIINAENGPVYIGKNAEIGEGSIIRGPFAMCEGAMLSLGSKMRGDITIGPKCKVGGEVSNSVFFGYSNKSHDGYLGNSVVGEWCNLGANTNNSNLKNNLGTIKVWDYLKGGFNGTDLQFCGAFIGDHVKLGINTMLNSGTVIGIGANVFGEGFPRKFISSFAWGGASGFSTFQLKKFEETTRKAMEMKGQEFTEAERLILQKVFEITRPYRIWDKGF